MKCQYTIIRKTHCELMSAAGSIVSVSGLLIICTRSLYFNLQGLARFRGREGGEEGQRSKGWGQYAGTGLRTPCCDD